MKILQCGAPKSGNLWLYQILKHILRFSGNQTTSFIEQQPISKIAKSWDLNYPDQAKIDVLDITDLQCSYRISSIYKMPIDNLEEYVSQTSLVWTHSPVCKASEEVFRHFDKKIYIIRDPRDRAISASKYYCSDYMLKYFPQEIKEPEVFLNQNFDHLMHEWVWHVFDHIRLSHDFNIHIVFYENLLNQFQKELDGMLDYLQVFLDGQQRKQLEDLVSFSTMKRENPKHLKKGASGYWKEHLSDEQVEKAAIIAGPLMQYLNYPSDRFEATSTPECAKNTVFDTLKNEIIQSQKKWYHHS